MKDKLLHNAEDWALHAYLRSCPDKIPHGDVEEALVWALFYLWASENWEE